MMFPQQKLSCTFICGKQFIPGFSCAEYNEVGGCIQPNFDIKCDGPKFYPKCPFKYPYRIFIYVSNSFFKKDYFLWDYVMCTFFLHIFLILDSGCFVFGNDKVENGSITKIRTTPKGNPANK